MNTNERNEYMAEQFHRDTGFMAPWKDGATDIDFFLAKERWKSWDKWCDEFYSNLFTFYINGTIEE